MKDDWDVFMDGQLEDPAFASAWEARRTMREAALAISELRARLGLSQRALAERAGMKQPEVARLEAADVNPTWETLSHLFEAVGAEVAISVRNAEGKRIRVVMKEGSKACLPAFRAPEAPTSGS